MLAVEVLGVGFSTSGAGSDLSSTLIPSILSTAAMSSTSTIRGGATGFFGTSSMNSMSESDSSPLVSATPVPVSVTPSGLTVSVSVHIVL